MFSLLGKAPTNLLRTTYSTKEVLLKDDKIYDVLTIGTNLQGENMVSSLMLVEDEADDPSENVEYYFHLLPRKEEFDEFKAGLIPYKALFNRATTIFVVAQRYGNRPSEAYHVRIDEIPFDYLPASNSFIPKPKKTQ